MTNLSTPSQMSVQTVSTTGSVLLDVQLANAMPEPTFQARAYARKRTKEGCPMRLGPDRRTVHSASVHVHRAPHVWVTQDVV